MFIDEIPILLFLRTALGQKVVNNLPFMVPEDMRVKATFNYVGTHYKGYEFCNTLYWI